jgi:hypothetical protein
MIPYLTLLDGKFSIVSGAWVGQAAAEKAP